jgi:hypothetical protein
MIADTSYSDLELLNGLKARKRKAYIDLYDFYSAPLYKIIYSITEDDDLTNFILCNVYIVTCQEIDNYDADKSTLFNFMKQFALTKSMDSVRARSFMIPSRPKSTVDGRQFLSYLDQILSD